MYHYAPGIFQLLQILTMRPSEQQNEAETFDASPNMNPLHTWRNWGPGTMAHWWTPHLWAPRSCTYMRRNSWTLFSDQFSSIHCSLMEDLSLSFPVSRILICVSFKNPIKYSVVTLLFMLILGSIGYLMIHMYLFNILVQTAW